MLNTWEIKQREIHFSGVKGSNFHKIISELYHHSQKHHFLILKTLIQLIKLGITKITKPYYRYNTALIYAYILCMYISQAVVQVA